MVKKIDIPKVALAASLDLAATVGWRDVSLRDIAEEAGVSLVQLRGIYPSKGAILDAFACEIDSAVLAGDSAELAAEPARDRLFDVMMRRFDALCDYRDAVRSIIAAGAADPCAALGGACRLTRSMHWMLEAAGIESSGIAGRLRAKGLAAIHIDVMRTWLNDDSADMAKTMSALDKRLEQADRVMANLCRLTRSRDDDPAPATSEAA
ncbi:MAG: TetR family transcriptional regulator [Alphaproteobacteria bacterium]|jgi:AcrR family transcriptional regulator|nr:TetR family transcriptional regulator [Rhodospirillaceae bacterium]MDG2481663.1 TetR family transcriptional regulator [Alphaproteobacteria bacterium]MBT5432412.1 TetR family transcriptional regulator [Rhodospirillaceae bacterium]MBT6204832.1 TetR family transcriptional regulator [Rhodospirillaceae bacterium]MBT6510417.1 TetR family transcriptional regulator [Rhodospirillaceae bacterium]